MFMGRREGPRGKTKLFSAYGMDHGMDAMEIH